MERVDWSQGIRRIIDPGRKFMVCQGHPGRVRHVSTLYHIPLTMVATGSGLVLSTTTSVHWRVRTTRWRGPTQTCCKLPCPSSKSIPRLITYYRHPRETFGHPSKMRIFAQNVAEWLPHGIITFFLERSKHLGIVRLRENREESRQVARTLIDQKQEELTGGTPQRDILSLLGSSLSSWSRNDTNGVI